MPDPREQSPTVTYYTVTATRSATAVTFPVSGQTVYLRGRLPEKEAIARACEEVGPYA